MFIKEVDEAEILNIVAQFEFEKSKDHDDINMFCLKYVIDSIVKPITYICNQSFITGVFPDKMKIAKVVPLLKAREKDIFTNYRPVSIL